MKGGRYLETEKDILGRLGLELDFEGQGLEKKGCF